MNDQVTSSETAEILRLAEQCLGLDGDFVELGCYRGDTSILLGKLLQKPKKPSFCQGCGKPVENLWKNSDNLCKNTDKMCKSSIESVEKVCKTPQNYHKHNQNHSDNLQNQPQYIQKCLQDSEKSPQYTQNYPQYTQICTKYVQKFSENTQNLSQNPEKSQQIAEIPQKLWLYDSFEGLPEKTAEDHSGAGQNFQKGELLVTKRAVVEKIRKHNLKNIIVKKAWFEDLTDRDLPARIAFAFLDGDLYSSIKVSLKLVAPRLAHQGIMVVHDYNNPELPGSARAVDEFLRAHPEYRLQQKYSLAILRRK